MVIKSLYKDYFPKSKVFLYPILEIKRGASVTPVGTYISWKDHYTPEDKKLICVYHLRTDVDFKIFEKTKLLGNKYFHDFKQVEDNKGVYIFDFSSNKEDWDNFLKGRYSKFSQEQKKKIKNFIGESSPHMPYIDSFLNPEKYFKLYAELMNVSENMLRDVGELCSLPDMEKETLKISVLDFEPNQKNILS